MTAFKSCLQSLGFDYLKISNEIIQSKAGNFFLAHKCTFVERRARFTQEKFKMYDYLACWIIHSIKKQPCLLKIVVWWYEQQVEELAILNFKVKILKQYCIRSLDFSLNGNQYFCEGFINWSMKPLEDFCASFLTWLKRKLQRPKRKKRHFSCRASVKDHLQSLHDIESSSQKTKLNQSELCTTYLSWWNLSVQVTT